MRHRAICTILALAACPPAWGQGERKLTPLEAINRANPKIVDWQVIGTCKVGQLVQHWIPVAWGETAPAGQSFIEGVREAAEKTSVLRTSGLESSSSARVLNFSNLLWMRSDIARSYGNRVCRISDASVPANLTSFDTTSCESAASVRQRVGQAALLTPDIHEVYTSGYDSGWTSGCRDGAAVEEAVVAQVRCNTTGLGAQMQPGGTRATALAQLHCVGQWGSLYPRQAREIGLTGSAASVKTILRAMSTARDHLGVVPYPADQAGKFQMSVPRVSDGFATGTRDLPGSVAALPANRRAAWIYWRKVVCCV